MNCCRYFLRRIQDNENFVFQILWTDEATFTNNGNRHNEHTWSVENPRLGRNTKNQIRYSVNVWCGIFDKWIIGPHFFNGTLTGQRYLNFLESDLPILFHDSEIPLSVRQNMRYFQQEISKITETSGTHCATLRNCWKDAWTAMEDRSNTCCNEV